MTTIAQVAAGGPVGSRSPRRSTLTGPSALGLGVALLWFSLLAVPLAISGTIAIMYSLWLWAGGSAPLSIPIAGTGVILLVSAFILFCSGAVGELVYKLGDMREREFARLTERVEQFE